MELVVALLLLLLVDSGLNQRNERSIFWDYDYDPDSEKGLFPSVFNLATSAKITTNATCGETGPENYCKLVEHVFMREPQCGICDASNPSKQHPITNAIDGTNRWWQSPTLQNGKQFEWVTITLDLKQVYQVAYVIVKAAISPRPGNWILEHSLDGLNYQPWQYYVISDSECWEIYRIPPTLGTPKYRSDDEVICTSYYSKLNPFENGEIHTSLVNGRPGVDGPSDTLRKFTTARYVRLRLQKIRTLNADLMTLQTNDPERIDKAVTRRYFYSIKDISIGGQCVCYGHARDCLTDSSSGKQQCKCEHNTCGENCDFCCPLYNQKPWRAGNTTDGAVCEMCQCFGHAESCYYDQNVADRRESLNIEGQYEGGGVCENCKHNTAGINCEQCADGYYRNAKQDSYSHCQKCKCTAPGMTGICVKDGSHLQEGLAPGDCLCKEGFTGKNCNECAKGYRNYPFCEPCPCHFAGTVDGTTCEGSCTCKINVEGIRCDKCKKGYYHLSADNPDGCSPCFCFGVSKNCTSSDWGIEIITKTEGWLVTDIDGHRIAYPTMHNKQFMIANDDMLPYDNYYWLAPKDYIGKKLYSYGGELSFRIRYIIARGDTSGQYTEDPDVILEGNNVRLGYNWGMHPEEDTFTIRMPLREQNWFYITSTGRASPVSRETFTFVLNNVNRLLIRAKFHTDQVEGILKDIGLETASKTSKSLKKMIAVEKCICPLGYTGLSCELCVPGFRRVNSTLPGGVCQKCDCYNHAESCDAITGECQNCLHHTTGDKCDRCLPGYYGDAREGTSGDCKRCACPLENPENNFSPTCREISPEAGVKDYICLLCPPGYEGNKCERCSDGYFGNPKVPGGFCQVCDCNNNVDTSISGYCDHVTGQCLRCLGNTGGWNCGECLDRHYGNPKLQDCRPCDCNQHGSEFDECDQTTGQCICKPNYLGRKCDRCADGYGNIEAGCVPCWCNRIGAKSETCDPITGRCICKPGVFGARCDSCLENHYGYSEEGCKACDCYLIGSVDRRCDETSGQCACKHHVTGRRCDHCEPGYWNIASRDGCEQCRCNSTGILSPVCEETTGQCNCKPGIGGKECDRCLSGYYGYTSRGCRQCDPCDVPGRICDPKNGRCVCPPYTEGDRCQFCTPNAHGYDPIGGCEPCNCNPRGSINQKCDDVTGNCFCQEGFEGRHCDICKFGYYQFPNCFKCDCNSAGTDLTRCHLDEGQCQCDERGQCPCKENVIGKTCDRCKENAFGLLETYSKGCFECFCFGHTQQCNQANLMWSKLTAPDREVEFGVGNDEISALQGFRVIPGQTLNTKMNIPYVLDQPLYWNLPKEFLGDKVLSYNGRLQFSVTSHSGSHFPDAFLHRYPLVIIQGNGRLVLTHTPRSLSNQYTIHLHEDEWQDHENPQTPVTRAMIMIALQRLQLILIRATTGSDVKYARLSDLSLEIAEGSFHQNPLPAHGVEVCYCPPKYTGSSCQDPAPGYYRKRKPNYPDYKNILDLVGWAEPCNCNNRSKICDQETGICINCTDYSTGPHCESCIKGFYEDVNSKRCLPCSCPLPTNRFSDTCRSDGIDYICINCQQGYTGRHCERCADGYYGNPNVRGGSCEPCNCNTYGSKSQICDKVTGKCLCLEGLVSRDCSECKSRHILTEYGCKSCIDECTGALFADLDYMNDLLNKVDLSNISVIPWAYLLSLQNQSRALIEPVNVYVKRIAFGKKLIDNFTIYFDLESLADILFVESRDMAAKAILIASNAERELLDANELLKEIQNLRKQLADLVAQLGRHGQDPSRPGSTTGRLLDEAERILRELKKRDFEPKRRQAEKELKKAHDLLERVKGLTLDRDHLDDLRDRLDVLEHALINSIKLINEDVKQPTHQAQNIIQGTRGALEEIQDAIDKILEVAAKANKTLTDADKILEKARNAVIDADVKYDSLARVSRELDNATNELEEKFSILSRLNPLYKEKYVIPAQKQAEYLEKQAEHLVNLFNATRAVSVLPKEAAQSYQSIVDALNAAKEAAHKANDAAENAYREAYPIADTNLPEKAKKAKYESLGLLDEANKLKNEDVPELDELLFGKRHALDAIGRILRQGQRGLDIVNRDLDGLHSGIPDVLRQAKSNKQRAAVKIDEGRRKVNEINDLIEKELYPRLDLLTAGTKAGLENFTQIIEKARSDIKGASRTADVADEVKDNVSNTHAKMQLNLKELKDKILLARQKASSIRVSIGSKRNKCVRSFKPDIEPTTTNNIIINFAVKSETQNSLLLFLGSSKAPANQIPDDFMAVEMVNRKIRFLWNAGGGTQFIQHDLTIETNDQQLSRNEQWYKIEVQRFGNIASLSVKPTPDGKKHDPYEVVGASPAGFSKMDLDASSYFYIGGLPPGYKAPKELKSRTLGVCIYEVILDGKAVGLWNFQTNVGCEGCKEGATEDIDSSAYQLNGDGYAILPQIKRYNKNIYQVTIWFKTYDENSLLFMAPGKNGDYVSLELKNGHIVYHLSLGGSSNLILRSKKKYNNAQWTQVAAGREKLNGQLAVEDEFLESTIQKGGPATLDIQDSQLYYGGVPPNFSTSNWPEITFQNFLGCMKDLQIDTTPIDLLKNVAYGIEGGCIDKSIKVASFRGTGYLELKGQPLPQDSSFGFSFQTNQKDALLLLSVFERKRSPDNRQKHYYFIAIIDGKLEVKVNSGNDISEMSSDVTINDGEYHTVTLIKRKRNISMRIDDEEVSHLRLPKGIRDIEATSEGRLYFGGIPPDFEVDSDIASRPRFHGTIKDAIFNDKLLNFNEPLRFEGVGIGRTSSTALNSQFLLAHPTESCAKSIPHSIEKKAVNFGGSSKGFVHVNLAKREISRDFTLGFDFRTYENYGLILLLQNTKRKHHFAIMIEKNHLIVDLLTKQDKIKLQLVGIVNDGNWHSVAVRKSKRQMWIVLDGREKEVEVNRRFNFKNILHIGDVKNAVLSKQLVKEKFQGCIRNLHVNEKYREIPEDPTYGTSPCISSIEQGAYFNDGAYAVFDSYKKVQQPLDIHLEFKTNQMDGLLMRIGSKIPNLLLYLQEGKLKVSVNADDNIELTQEFPSKFAMCNNQWHTVNVHYSYGKLSMKVNALEIIRTEGNWNQYPDESNQDIYVGGFTEDNSTFFTGCIKNIKINNKPLPWMEAMLMKNVISSCPLS
ncbi:LOW QUALITY PROTEIN: laminin subunit alpha lam-3-like [Centruroides vittatus]|uniref:LOW QUALITY PROTEIN: laminin subunit alpha lam-3-like n=1 Tax=Centruroides vittatus TaxID=120091 RepID=UPI0035109586